MRTLLLCIVLSVLFHALPAGASSAFGAPAAARRVVRVVMDDNYPPYAFRGENGEVKGIVVDQWRLWEKKTGVAVQLTATDWADAQKRMQAGEFDVIDTIFRSDKREKIYDFTKSYAEIPVPLFFHVEISGISGVKDAKGFAVAAKAGGMVVDYLHANGIANVVEYPSYEAIVAAARDGNVKVFTVDRPPALYYLNKMGIVDRFRETPPMFSGRFHRAVRKGNLALLRRVEEGFALISDSEYKAIDRRWLGAPIANAQLRHVLPGTLAALGVILALSGMLVFLRRAVKQRTAELAESEAKYRELVEMANTIILKLDREGRITYLNDYAQHFFGFTLDEIAGQSVVGTIVPHTDRAGRDLTEMIRLICDNPDRYQENENDNVTKDGRIVQVLWANRAMVGRRGEILGVLSVGFDVSEQRRMEERLLHAQKMESIGRLAGGVAHDFNNMLSVIIGCAGLCKANAAQDDPNWKYLDQIERAAQRSSQITGQLLAFSRKQVVEPRAVNLNALIHDAEGMLCRLIGEDVRLRFHPGDGVWPVMGDPAQLHQILMNLSANARDAMPDGGALTIETANVTIGASALHHDEAAEGDYVRLTVTDTGCGMDRRTRDHLFEPFFTTKGVGKGTGLGLATVYGIVTQGGGFIDCRSNPGEGTVFEVHLPRVLQEPVPEEEGRPQNAPAGTGTILLVEDEEMLLWATTKMLEGAGYRVIQAPSPEAAIAVCTEALEPVDLILTDVVMPGMNGKEMAERIKALRPSVKVLFMSGYTADVTIRRGIAAEGTSFINKPLDMKRLNEKIEQMLAAGAFPG